ncbi:MAG TPA: NPCBM/NEW2 domain-containing protein [Candidatus Limnocylindrales bacterium]|nr:NPCBM/NEW2 domain-containing protein [Candidatus Limnocylindrales bacterium]
MRTNFSDWRVKTLGLFLVLGLAAAAVRAEQVFPLGQLDLSKVQQDWGDPHANKSVENHTLSIGGQTFTNGLGTHAYSELLVDVDGNAEKFIAQVGVDQEVGAGRGNAQFQVLGDGHLLWQSDLLHAGDAPQSVDVSLDGVKQVDLVVTPGTNDISYAHADWANAEITMRTGAPEAASASQEAAVILTPKPSPEPRINGTRIFGVRPGSPFLFTIPATGDRPMTFSADHLPRGLRLDSDTGRITGELKKVKTFIVTLHARNALGEAQEQFKIVCGPQIGLTPAMGWNSWNCFASAVTEKDIKAAADTMVKSGLMNHGWTYINIDDFWEVNPHQPDDPTLQGPQRDAEGRILPNPRFPDMPGLTAYVHDKGLKIGLYSSPGPWTCGGCVASFDHELLDAQQYAQWGFDYLKYDWCSYSPELESHRGNSAAFVKQLSGWSGSAPSDRAKLMRPYAFMRAALEKQPRDILFSLCQYGMGNVWTWGAQVGGNSWRTTGDIRDTWSSMSANGFGEAGEGKYAGPGHFNDPDMLVVGYVGWGPSLHPTHLTPNEQYTHISLWCLLASPLLIGCDMTKLDAFTLGLLSNDEVLAVDQDPLARQASRVADNGTQQVWAKDMEDGSEAVGLFNLSRSSATVVAKWSELGLIGKQRVRDLWRQKDLGEFSDQFATTVPPHGVVLIRMWPVK